MAFDLSKIPPKPPAEEEITEKQLQFILSLDESLGEEKIRKLGKWQARAVIKELLAAEKRGNGGFDDFENDEEEDFRDTIPRGTKKKSGCGCLAISALGGIVLLAMIIAPNIEGISKATKSPAAYPTPTATPAATPSPTPFVPKRLKSEVSAKLEYGVIHIKAGMPIEVLGTENGGWKVRAQGAEFHVTPAQVE